MFKDGRTNIHAEERSGRPSVVSDDLQNVDQKICMRRRCTISKLLCEFAQFSPTALYEIITVRLGYNKFCARWVPKMLRRQRMASVLTFLERYHEDGDEFPITSYERQMTKPGFHLLMLKPTSSQSSGCRSIDQPSRRSSNRRLQEILTAVFWGKKGMMMVEFMQLGTTITPELYCKPLKNCVVPFRIVGMEC
jgi:hypothetical protein